MANTASNVSTGKPKVTGGIWRAPKGTTLPTDATTALDTTKFVCLGFVSEEGVTNSQNMDVSAIKAWGGVIVYRSLNELGDEFKFALIETENADVLKAVYGTGNVTVDGSGNIDVTVKADDPEEAVWVIELALRGGIPRRIVIPDAAITARDDIVYNDADAIAHGITLSAYPFADSPYNGGTHKEYTAGSAPSI